MKIRKESVWFDVVNYFLLSLFMLACIVPFYYILVASFSDPARLNGQFMILPEGFSFVNYVEIFKLHNIVSAFFVSTSRMVIGTLLTVFCCSLFSYVLTKKELILRKTMYRILVITMYLNAGLIPWYLTMKEYGLKNSFLLYILPGAVSAFYIILIKTYMEQIPPSLEESATVDGAGYLTLFSRIVFPLSIPIVATVAVFNAVGQWNSWMDNYFLVSTPHLQTLQLILYNYLSNIATQVANEASQSADHVQRLHVTAQSVKVTITVIVTLPILAVYPFLQRFFVKGIMLGAVKG